MKKIFTDAGHGGTDPGAVGKMSKYGAAALSVNEKDLTLDFAKELKKQLEASLDVSCIMSRTTDTAVNVNDRATAAYNGKVDAIISIHFNSGSTTAKGTETYYAKTRSADKAFADALQSNIVKWFGTSNRGVKDDTQTAVGSLAILRNHNTATYPRALIEVEFISNLSAMNDIGSEYYDRILDFCNGVVTGVKAYFKL